jgi:hypothetical protein
LKKQQKKQKELDTAKRLAERKAAEAKAQKIREAESTLKALEMKKKNALMTEKSSAASIKSADSEIAIAQKKLAGLKK